MSICRWSCDNFRSDVYIYECYGGWSVNVAGKHPVNPEILGEDFNLRMMTLALAGEKEEMQSVYKENNLLMKELEYAPLDSPYAGESFSIDSIDELEKLVYDLRESGVHVPQKVFEYIAEEKADDIS